MLSRYWPVRAVEPVEPVTVRSEEQTLGRQHPRKFWRVIGVRLLPIASRAAICRRKSTAVGSSEAGGVADDRRSTAQTQNPGWRSSLNQIQGQPLDAICHDAGGAAEGGSCRTVSRSSVPVHQGIIECVGQRRPPRDLARGDLRSR